jgi:hypothetical protein
MAALSHGIFGVFTIGSSGGVCYDGGAVKLLFLQCASGAGDFITDISERPRRLLFPYLIAEGWETSISPVMGMNFGLPMFSAAAELLSNRRLCGWRSRMFSSSPFLAEVMVDGLSSESMCLGWAEVLAFAVDLKC